LCGGRRDIIKKKRLILMKKTRENTDLEDILKYTAPSDLHSFLVSYATGNKEFQKALVARFGPQKSLADKVDYVLDIKDAFNQNILKEYRRYDGWDEFGFDAEEVAVALQPLLDKAGYYQQHENIKEVIRICQALIETVPEEWDPNFDYEGDVQVIYDSAIDKLQELLGKEILSVTGKVDLFEWYRSERKNKKHEHIGLNTSLEVLGDFFTDTSEMLTKNLSDMGKQIKNASTDYKKRNAVLNK